MKYGLLCFMLLFLTPMAHSQKRYLVSPTNDVIPLKNGESARTVIEKFRIQQQKQKRATATVQDSRIGYPPDMNPVDGTFLAFHKDVVGMWFESPASGSIDSIFWVSGFSVGAMDSIIFLRVFQSNINAQSGPGHPPYPPPCVNWGYYVSTQDFDQGLSPFIEDATDTTWHSTVSGTTPSFPPARFNIWGFSGIAVIDHVNSVNSLAMSEIGIPLDVQCGDEFFITMRPNSPNAHVENDVATTWTYSTTNVPSPSRLWKFYEHESPAECQGTFNHGWANRAFLNSDTMISVVLNWWYVMTVNGPSLNCPGDVFVNSPAGQCGATVTYTPPTSQCGAVTCTPASGSFFPLGLTEIDCSTPNGDNCSFNVIVNDNEPPTISVSLDPTVLSPPNHTLRDITATVSISDNCPGATFVLSSLTSNEPDNGLGDGDVPGDIQDAAIGTPDLNFKLRAERGGHGSGRVYTATYTVTDARGNTASASASVAVPVSKKVDPLSVPVIISNTRPDHIFLGQNYPNPFNPTTLISYGLPVDAGVSITVYDLLGRKVVQLVEGRVPAGYGNVEFDASGLPSGWYFYRMTAVGDDGTTFSETKKLMLLR